jgi:DNA (cytosine-5)-methyltransferase 1
MPDKGNFSAVLDVAHSLRAEGFDASEDGTVRGTPLVPVGIDLYNQSISGDIAATLSTNSGTGGGTGPSVMQAIAFHPTQEPIHSTDVCHALNANANATAAVAFDLAQVTSAANRTRVEPGLPASTLAKASRMHVAQPMAVAFNMHKSGNQASSLGVSEDRTDCLRAFEKSPFAVQPAPTMAVRRLTPKECARLQGFPDTYLDIIYRGKPAADGPKYKALGNSMAVPVMRWIGERIAAVHAMRQA